MPNSRYDSFTFISSDAFVIPCSRTETINVFIFRPTPPNGQEDRGPAIRHLCGLKLPKLVNNVTYVTVRCSSQPVPLKSANKSHSATSFPQAKKMYVPDPEDGVVLFFASIAGNGKLRDMIILTHRKALLSFIFATQNDLGDPLPNPWESYPMVPAEAWGPDIPFSVWRSISRCMVPKRSPQRWLSCVHGFRFAQILNITSPWAGHIQLMDFNPLFVRNPPLFPEDYHPAIQKAVHRTIITDATVIPADEIFEEDVVSNLPYYQVTTVDTFPLAGVLLDDERIIGLRVSFMILFRSEFLMLGFGLDWESWES